MQEMHTLILPCPQPFSSAMSVVALADTKCRNKKAAHRRDASDELDVFEAARYYAGIADATSLRSGTAAPHRATKEERRALVGGGGERRSVDVPMRMGALPSHYSHRGEKETKEKIKSKQPISPGGRLASFLNSFFHQGSSKKKSKSVTTTRSCKGDQDDQEISPNGRRKRRSSISHSHSTSSSKSSFLYSSSSGIRTPPLAYPGGKEKEVNARTRRRNKCSGQRTPTASSCPPCKEVLHEGRSNYGDLPWERSRRASTNGILEKGTAAVCSGRSCLEGYAAYGSGFAEKKWVLNEDGKGMVRRDLLQAAEVHPTERNMWRREEVEDGGESDSSSDLFELPNYELVHPSSGLPVYETTNMESIKT
uniref:Uncharacterized protein n=1 Tax=Anthurium amnicola TaxID=1678845 RepID=A0A1D1Y1K7_9ARAE